MQENEQWEKEFLQWLWKGLKIKDIAPIPYLFDPSHQLGKACRTTPLSPCPTPAHSWEGHSVWPLGPANPPQTHPDHVYESYQHLGPMLWLTVFNCYLVTVFWAGRLRLARAKWTQVFWKSGTNTASDFSCRDCEKPRGTLVYRMGAAAASVQEVIPSADVVRQSLTCGGNVLSLSPTIWKIECQSWLNVHFVITGMSELGIVLATVSQEKEVTLVKKVIGWLHPEQPSG